MPQVFQRTARFVAIKDWILHRLTDAWAADLSMTSGTGLLDIYTQLWDEEALLLAGVRADHLPPLVSPAAVVGGLTRRAAAETGLPAGLPVIAGAGDGATANLGAGAVAPGQVVVTVGTSGVIRRTVGSPWLDPEERTWCYFLVEGRWFAGGAINNGGLVLQWVRDCFYADLSNEEGFQTVLREAAAVVPGAEGAVMLPYFAGERSPHWNADVRATIYGLSLEHTRAHIARAALEGVAFCLADVWEALHSELAEPARLTGAITRAPVWAQIVADVLNIPLRPLEAADASAFGAAMLGHWALRHIENLGDLRTPVSSSVFNPDTDRHAFYAQRHRAFQSLYRSLTTVL
jgi:gluconokinase